METKQVIVIRKDLNMRKGKMVAQGAHASFLALTDKGFMWWNDIGSTDYYCFPMDNVIETWLACKFTKIVVGVNSEEELHEIYNKAKEAELHCSLVLDAGLTEFKEPTYTAVAVGPAPIEEIDKITGHLKLL